MKQHQLIVRNIVLILPLAIAFFWFVNLIVEGITPTTQEQLSPGKLNTLVTGLFIFIIAYSIFLYYILYRTKLELEKKQKVRHRG